LFESPSRAKIKEAEMVPIGTIKGAWEAPPFTGVYKSKG